MISNEITYEELQSTFAEVLQTALVLEPEPEPTFLQISEFPHYEEVISNWYAFFFRSAENHRLKTLFVDTLCEMVKEKTGRQITLSTCQVVRERGVLGKRIDLLLYDQADGEGEKQVYRNAIIIENKINASVYNDLNLYYKNITAEESKIGIVMSLQTENNLPDTYVSILHSEFSMRIAQNLGKYLIRANDRYLLLLKDFLQQLQSFTTTENMKDIIKFYYENAAKINELATIKSKALESIFMEFAVTLSDTDFHKGRRYTDSLNIRYDPAPNVLIQFKATWLFEDHYYDIELWFSGDLAKKWATNEALRERIKDTVKPFEGFAYNNEKTGAQWAYIGLESVQMDKRFDLIENLSKTIATDLQKNWKPFLTALTNELNK